MVILHTRKLSHFIALTLDGLSYEKVCHFCHVILTIYIWQEKWKRIKLQYQFVSRCLTRAGSLSTRYSSHLLLLISNKTPAISNLFYSNFFFNEDALLPSVKMNSNEHKFCGEILIWKITKVYKVLKYDGKVTFQY